MSKISRSRAKASPSVRLLKVVGIHAPIEVHRHPTARRLTLPRSSDFREADQFLSRSLEWVRERLECVPEPAPFVDGATVPLRGVPHKIIFTGESRRGAVVRVDNDEMRRVPILRIFGLREHAPRRLKDWLIAEAAAISMRVLPIMRARSACAPGASPCAIRKAAGALAPALDNSRSPGVS
jgi:predicted metal-dependent hydrolase